MRELPLHAGALLVVGGSAVYGYTAEQMHACADAEREACAKQLEDFANRVAPTGRFNSSFDDRVAYVLRQQAREMRGYAQSSMQQL